MAHWHILEVMPRNFRRRTWVALLIDADPRGPMLPDTKEAWLYLGKHQTYRRAWNCAEKLLSRHDAPPLILPAQGRRAA